MDRKQVSKSSKHGRLQSIFRRLASNDEPDSTNPRPVGSAESRYSSLPQALPQASMGTRIPNFYPGSPIPPGPEQQSQASFTSQDMQQALLVQQMQSMQFQMQQMQQMMQHMLTSSNPKEEPVSTNNVAVEMPTIITPTLHNRNLSNQPVDSGSRATQQPVYREQRSANQSYIPRSNEVQDYNKQSDKKLLICVVCSTSKIFVPLGQSGKSEFPRKYLTPSCTHNIQVCNDCLRQWIESRLESQGCNGISCPQCLEQLDRNVIRKYASSKVFARYGHGYMHYMQSRWAMAGSTYPLTYTSRYEDLVLRASLAASPNFRYCINSKCDSGQEHIPGAIDPIITCVSCTTKMCFTCDVVWHEGETCGEYNKRKEDQHKAEKASEDWISQNTKKCTKCKTTIQMYGGCAHLSCKWSRFKIYCSQLDSQIMY